MSKNKRPQSKKRTLLKLLEWGGGPGPADGEKEDDDWCGDCQWGNTKFTCNERVQYMVKTHGISLNEARKSINKDCRHMIQGHSQLQDSHATSTDRYPDEYSFVKHYVDTEWFNREDSDDKLKLLSYGSSTGEEAISLASLYFNESRYKNVQIYGVDIDEATLETARQNVAKRGGQIQRNITFFHGEHTPISVHKYDVIFANSVLCFHPKKFAEIVKHFPFSKYEKALESLDESLKEGGLLAMVNMNYNFEDTVLAKKYVPVGNCNGNFVPRINRDMNEMVHVQKGQIMDCVWIKKK